MPSQCALTLGPCTRSSRPARRASISFCLSAPSKRCARKEASPPLMAKALSKAGVVAAPAAARHHRGCYGPGGPLEGRAAFYQDLLAAVGGQGDLDKSKGPAVLADGPAAGHGRGEDGPPVQSEAQLWQGQEPAARNCPLILLCQRLEGLGKPAAIPNTSLRSQGGKFVHL
jgi:hypothetical protein